MCVFCECMLPVISSKNRNGQLGASCRKNVLCLFSSSNLFLFIIVLVPLSRVPFLQRKAMLRFSIAAGVVAAFVLGRERDDVDAMVAKERNLAFWSGAEIGLWYSIGYLAQAEGLQTVSAGKVRSTRKTWDVF